jgi:predicted Rossmann fold nucleotide-binding protein DprA/Smf involved in DNA uptake
VPGPIDAPGVAGCLALLREFPDAVRVVAGIPQLIADLGFAGLQRPGQGNVDAPDDPVAMAALTMLGRTERLVAEQLLAGRRTVDEVVAALDLPVATVLATIALLERRGCVAGAYGRYRPDGPLLGAPPIPRRR